MCKVRIRSRRIVRTDNAQSATPVFSLDLAAWLPLFVLVPFIDRGSQRIYYRRPFYEISEVDLSAAFDKSIRRLLANNIYGVCTSISMDILIHLSFRPKYSVIMMLSSRSNGYLPL
jgi:hypothetical protein